MAGEPIPTAQAPSPDGGTVAESPATPKADKAGRRSDTAYRALQSERDRLAGQARAQAERDRANQMQIAQLSRQVEDLQIQQSLSGLPEEERQQQMANVTWARRERELQQAQQALAQLQAQHNAFLSQEGRLGALAESIARHRPPDRVLGVPVLRFLLQHTQGAQSVEEMDALVAKVAADLGAGKAKAKGKAKGDKAKAKAPDAQSPKAAKAPAPDRPAPAPPRPGGKYLGGEGQSSPNVPWSQRSKDERAKVWKEFKDGVRTFDQIPS